MSGKLREENMVQDLIVCIEQSQQQEKTKKSSKCNMKRVWIETVK
jgi:hypothetical protein